MLVERIGVSLVVVVAAAVREAELVGCKPCDSKQQRCGRIGVSLIVVVVHEAELVGCTVRLSWKPDG